MSWWVYNLEIAMDDTEAVHIPRSQTINWRRDDEKMGSDGFYDGSVPAPAS